MAKYHFPEDLDSDETKHYMVFYAIRPGETSFEDAIGTFIPGGGPNGQLEYSENYAYEDVKIMSNLLGSVGAGALNMVGMAGKTINPKVEVLFRNADLREYQFDMLFAPVSEKETQSLKNIIQTFRKHAHPELIGAASNPLSGYVGSLGSQARELSTGGIYNSPSEFIIKFYNIVNGGSVENKNMPMIARSVLTGMQTLYTPDGMYSTFRNGYPVSVRLSMRFREMRIIDRQNVVDGF